MNRPGARSGRKSRSRSIIRSAAIVFSLTVILPALAMAALEFYVSSYYRGETNLLTRLFKPEPPIARLSKLANSIMRRVNRALVERPKDLVDPAFLAGLVGDNRSVAVALRVGNRLAAVFGFKDRLPTPYLPLFGELDDPGMPLPDPDRHLPFVLGQVDFWTADGLPASIFVLGIPSTVRDGRALFGFSRTLAFVVIAALFLLNGGAGLYFMRRLVRPLGALEKAAETLGSGRFDAPVEAPGYAELDPVFRAVETMRTRLDGLIGRVRAEESSRRELIANLSHDVRTPLTVLRGYVDGLLEGVADTPERRVRYLAVLREQTKRLERMMEDIFLLATLQSREEDSVSRPVDLAQFLGNGVEELALALKDAAAPRFEDAAAGPPAMVKGDPFRLRRLVENLVRNSVEHSGRDRPVEVRIRLKVEGGEAVVTVSDSGKGFPAGKLDRAFDRFWRADEARTDEGSGLGLAIAREIVLAHGGTVSARNGAGEAPWPGAVVEFRLPLLPPSGGADWSGPSGGELA